MKETIKLNKVFPSLTDVLNCISENEPKGKLKKNTVHERDENGLENVIIYTLEDNNGVKHVFKISPEGVDSFKLIYTSYGEYPEYIADDLDNFF